MEAYQAPLSLGFPRQERWSGLPFPSPMHGSEKWKWSRSVVSNSVRPHWWHPSRLPRPWDSPGRNTGVGCHFLLRCMKVKSESEVAQPCPTLSDPMDCSPPGFSIHGICQAGVLEWVAIACYFFVDIIIFKKNIFGKFPTVILFQIFLPFLHWALKLQIHWLLKSSYYSMMLCWYFSIFS